jgi:hypothetical protein
MSRLMISLTILMLVFEAMVCTAQASSSECNPGPVSIPFLTKPGDGWDVNFAKQAIAIKNGPYILSDGKDSGFRYVEYEPKKQVITLPHIEVNPCNHTGTIRDWHLIPKQVIGFEKNGRVFAYRVWVQMVAGPTPDSQVIGSNTHVIFYDMQGNGVFDSVRLGSGIETPLVPDWVKNGPTKVPMR